MSSRGLRSQRRVWIDEVNHLSSLGLPTMFQVDGRPDLSGGKRRARPPNEGRKTYDEARMRFVEAEGYLVVRFWNGGAFAHLDGVRARQSRKEVRPRNGQIGD